ncbi:MmgE/PrpD family protein [Chloroflexota bacterium]
MIDGKHGFLRTFANKEVKVEALSQGLGRRFEGAANASFKPYPSGNLVNAATWATLQLVKEHNITPEQVAEIRVGVAPHCYDVVGAPFVVRDKPQVDAQFSVQYTVANALVRRSSKLEHFTESYIRNPEILSVVTKVHPEIDYRVVGEGSDNAAAIVEIRLNDGSQFSLNVKYPKGRQQNPLSDAEITEKFRECVAFSNNLLSPEDGEDIIKAIDRLEEIEDVTEVAKLLVF